MTISTFLNDTLKKTYRKHSAAFMTKVVLEALKERETLSEPAQRHALHPTQIATWKKEFLEGAEQVFGEGPVVDAKAHEQEKAHLHQQIGELTVTVNRLKNLLWCAWKSAASWLTWNWPSLEPRRTDSASSSNAKSWI